MKRSAPLARPFARAVMFGLLMLLSSVLVVGTAAAQDDADAGTEEAAAATPEPKGVFTLIIEHVDFVTVIIGILSVIALTLIIQGFIVNRKGVVVPEDSIEQMRTMISERRFKELLEFTEQDKSFVSQALNPALKRAPNFSSMKESLETAVGELTANYFRRIEYLNIIGNMGPLLGLLGTVLGMINAFSAMQAAGGDVGPDVLAGGISTALAHTFLGLFLAVPALAAFGILRTIVDRLTTRGAIVSEELLLMMKPDAKPSASKSSSRREPAAAGAEA